MRQIAIFKILILFVTSLSLAQVNIEINDNMLIETTGGLVIEVSGDVIETGTGYLKGVVTSGDRAGVTQFAGLTLSSSLEGRITRTTGRQYSGTGTNFTLYYTIDNQNASSDLTANVTTVTTTAEHGSLTGPFFHYTKNGSNWKGYGFGSTTTTVVSNDALFPQSSVTDLVISEGVGFKGKIFLEGPYNSGIMDTTINSEIPLLSPYLIDARTASTKPATAVDWVLIELRDQTTPSTIIASRSAYLNFDGKLIDDNATSGRGVGIAAPPGDYYIAIKHRNHLAVMTQNAQTGLTWGTASTVSNYDFTTGSGQFYGGTAGAKELEIGVWGMLGGDVNQNGLIDSIDLAIISADAFYYQTGYQGTDLSCDGFVDLYDLGICDNNSFNNVSAITPMTKTTITTEGVEVTKEE